MNLQEFLEKHSKFKGLYHEGLEVQIMVAQDEGTKKGNGFVDHSDFWYHLRIIKPGVVPKYSLERHAESIGLSGWNFKEKKSEWVGFDFDSLVGHKAGLSDAEIKEIISKAKEIPWIEIRRSTSGRGIHFYIFLDNCTGIANSKEHRLLAKVVLRTLSGLLNFDFKSKVDGAGGILWVWSRKQKPEGFDLIKPATEKFSSIPGDWKNEQKEFRGKVLPLTHDLKFFSFNPDQQKLLNWFAKQKTTWWWDAELNMLVCHTHDLAKAHKELGFKGVFYTNAQGNDCPNDQNCFAFPIKNGSWIIRRHTQGCKEHPYWSSDKSGWTYCYYNKIPSVADLVELFNGQTNSKSEFIFTSGRDVEHLLAIVAPTKVFNCPPLALSRKYTLKSLKNSRVSIKFERSADDPLFPGWITNRNWFERVIGVLEEEQEIITPDNLVRHVISNSTDSGWYLNSKTWVFESKTNISSALVTLGYKGEQIEQLVGQCILNPWELVNRPFEPEYLGNRQWNKFSPQLIYDPKEGDWSKWREILEHLGKNLTTSVEKNSWCRAYEIKTGADYLLHWTACIFTCPLEPLPYLFLYGPQLSGKSTFHEALSLLVTKGVVRADRALTNPSGFNGELAGAILCVIEETNLTQSKVAYNRIKDWVTSRVLPIRDLFKTSIDLQNSCHWLQCANHPDYCPVQFGDTRIVMIEVDVPERVRPKEEMFGELREQAPAFIHKLLNLKVPPAIDRLRIPVIETEEKMDAQHASANLVERFIREKCFRRLGHIILLSDFRHAFHAWLSQNGQTPWDWTTVKISRAIPNLEDMPIKGRAGTIGQIHLGNVSFNEGAVDESFMFVKAGNQLVKRKL